MKTKEQVYEYHRKALCGYRLAHDLTQEKMAEMLEISVRCYWDQEHGRYGFSGISILRFLLLIGTGEWELYFREMEGLLCELLAHEAEQ